mmetsp:Transcript_117848/g.330001  ORF Transcript_117848/g.330001 Transcript_117848/m.330001 type:complete len:80 (+) Transcript_117848:1110-1349(+)
MSPTYATAAVLPLCELPIRKAPRTPELTISTVSPRKARHVEHISRKQMYMNDKSSAMPPAAASNGQALGTSEISNACLT